MAGLAVAGCALLAGTMAAPVMAPATVTTGVTGVTGTTAMVAEDLPRPPPVDMGRLPASGTPAGQPGARQKYRCVGAAGPVGAGSASERLWGQRMFRLPELWNAGEGGSVRIAVIDTGVSQHPRLAGRLLAGGDFVAGGDGLADCDGHGTLVAGIAAASVDSGSGFAGVAPEAQVLSVRQSSPRYAVPGPGGAESPAGNLETLASAVLHAVDLGADVINISEVACAPAGARGAAELQAAIHRAVQRNVVVVAAAGNLGSGRQDECPDRPRAGTVVYPGWFDQDVLTVASVGPGGVASRFNYPGPWVDVAAPGERLVSLSAGGSGVTDQMPGSEAGTPIDGTSFAAPSVAGLAALIRARYPRLTAAQVMDRITATASQHASGRTDSAGYGVVDPVAALTRGPAVLPPPGDPAGTDAGTLRLAPPAQPASVPPGALWGGLLALLATVPAGAFAVSKLRAGWRTDTRR